MCFQLFFVIINHKNCNLFGKGESGKAVLLNKLKKLMAMKTEQEGIFIGSKVKDFYRIVGKSYKHYNLRSKGENIANEATK